MDSNLQFNYYQHEDFSAMDNVPHPGLSVPLKHQELLNWCWVAVGASLINYYKKENIEQCDLATQVLMCDEESGVLQSCCPPTNNGPCDQPWYVGRLLEDFGLYQDKDLKSGPASYDEIKMQIDQGNPIVVRIEWDEGRDPNPAHFIIVDGYCEKGEDDYLIVGDPADDNLTDEDDTNDRTECKYNNLFRNYRSSKAKWTHTYFTQLYQKSDPITSNPMSLRNVLSPKNPTHNSKTNNKVHIFASKIAEIASDASDYYYEAQEIAQDILAEVKLDDGGASLETAKNASSIAYNASKELKNASRALQRVHLLYAKIINSQDEQEVSLYLQQLSKERTRVELAIKKIMNYKHEIDFLKQD